MLHFFPAFSKVTTTIPMVIHSVGARMRASVAALSPVVVTVTVTPLLLKARNWHLDEACRMCAASRRGVGRAAGSGPSPTATTTMVCNWRVGWLLLRRDARYCSRGKRA